MVSPDFVVIIAGSHKELHGLAPRLQRGGKIARLALELGGFQ